MTSPPLAERIEHEENGGELFAISAKFEKISLDDSSSSILSLRDVSISEITPSSQCNGAGDSTSAKIPFAEHTSLPGEYFDARRRQSGFSWILPARTFLSAVCMDILLAALPGLIGHRLHKALHVFVVAFLVMRIASIYRLLRHRQSTRSSWRTLRETFRRKYPVTAMPIFARCGILGVFAVGCVRSALAFYVVSIYCCPHISSRHVFRNWPSAFH